MGVDELMVSQACSLNVQSFCLHGASRTSTSELLAQTTQGLNTSSISHWEYRTNLLRMVIYWVGQFIIMQQQYWEQDRMQNAFVQVVFNTLMTEQQFYQTYWVQLNVQLLLMMPPLGCTQGFMQTWMVQQSMLITTYTSSSTSTCAAQFIRKTSRVDTQRGEQIMPSQMQSFPVAAFMGPSSSPITRVD